MLNDEELLHAASPTLDPQMIAGIKKTKKDGKISGKAALPKESFDEIEATMKKTISDTARSMYSGKAPRTPSKESCKFCKMKSTCPVADKS
jgi:ATP-dependent helicase/DNAse subunit B